MVRACQLVMLLWPLSEASLATGDRNGLAVARLLASRRAIQRSLGPRFFETLLELTGAQTHHRTIAAFEGTFVPQLPRELAAECTDFLARTDGLDSRRLCYEAIADFLLVWKAYLVSEADVVASFPSRGESLIYGAYTLAVHVATCLVQRPGDCNLWHNAVATIDSGRAARRISAMIVNFQSRQSMLAALGSGSGVNLTHLLAQLNDILNFEFAAVSADLNLPTFFKLKSFVRQTGLPVTLAALVLGAAADDWQVLPSPADSRVLAEHVSSILLPAEVSVFPQLCQLRSPASAEWQQQCAVSQSRNGRDSLGAGLVAVGVYRGLHGSILEMVQSRLATLWSDVEWLNTQIHETGVADLLWSLVHTFHIDRVSLPAVCARTELLAQCASALASHVAAFWLNADDGHWLERFAVLEAARRTNENARFACLVAMTFPKTQSLQVTLVMAVAETGTVAAAAAPAAVTAAPASVFTPRLKHVLSTSASGFRQCVEVLRKRNWQGLRLNDLYIDGSGAVSNVLEYLKTRPELLFIRPLEQEDELEFLGFIGKLFLHELAPLNIYFELEAAAVLFLGASSREVRGLPGIEAVRRGGAGLASPRRLTVRTIQNALMWGDTGSGGAQIVSGLRGMLGSVESGPGRTREGMSVRRSRLLSDSIRLLQGGSLSAFRPHRTRIHFVDEPGDDAGGLTHEWLTLLSDELVWKSGLFQFERGGVVRVSPEVYYYAGREGVLASMFVSVGSLLGLAVRMNVPLGVEFEFHIYKALLFGAASVTVDDLYLVDLNLATSLDQLVLEDDPDMRAAIRQDLDVYVVEESLVFGQLKQVPVAGLESGLLSEEEMWRRHAEFRKRRRLTMNVLGWLHTGYSKIADNPTGDVAWLKRRLMGLGAEIEVNVWREKTVIEPEGREGWKSVELFWTVVQNELDNGERRKLLRFWTGLSNLAENTEYHLFVTSDASMPLLKAHACGRLLTLPFFNDHTQMVRVVRNTLAVGLSFSMM